MQEIPVNIRVLAFNKAEDEPLSAEELALWEEWESGRLTESTKINLDDPEALEIFQLYNKWEGEKEESFKELMAKIGKERISGLE